VTLPPLLAKFAEPRHRAEGDDDAGEEVINFV